MVFLGDDDEFGAGGMSGGKQPYAARVLATPGCIAYLPLTEAAGVNAADSKGGVNWTYTGGPTLNQFPGPGDGKPWAQFSGAGQWVAPSVAALAYLNTAGVFNPDEFTMGLWAQITNPADWAVATDHILFALNNVAGNALIMDQKGGKLIYQIYVGGFLYNFNYTVAAPTIFSMFFTGSRSANKARAFFQGTQVIVDKPYTGAAWVGALNNGGGIANWAGMYWPGYMGRVSLFNRALTPTEVAGLSVIS